MSASTAVDPRVRGEIQPPSCLARPLLGRSPRARGNHYFRAAQQSTRRSIPACAGKSYLLCVFGL